ncbi:MAG: type II toxin-antitoxin system VapC family toxin [Acidobacteria bacterium]|nr:type II toxin-antitoxin system VapC family toxin [Acidobacteriota bacterium]
MIYSAALFVDTWGWIALEDGRDPSHAAVAAIHRQQSETRAAWVTTDYVIDETCTRLFAQRPFGEAERFFNGIFASRDAGHIRIEAIDPDRFQAAWRLRLRYRDKPRISFTDFTSFAVMRELGIRRVLTADAHFEQVRLGFQVVPGRQRGS